MQQVVQICNLNSLIFRTECTRICTKTTGAQGSVCVGAAEGDGGEGFSEKIEKSSGAFAAGCGGIGGDCSG